MRTRFPLWTTASVLVLILTGGASTMALGQSTVVFSTPRDLAKASVVHVTTPNGGQSLRSGGIQIIRWRLERPGRPVHRTIVDYSINGGRKWQRAAVLSQLEDGSDPTRVTWSIPPVPRAKTKCLVRVLLRDAQGKTIGQDASDQHFTIRPNSDESVSQEITKDGGTVRLTDSKGNVVSLAIPPDALSAPTVITMTALKRPVGDHIGTNVFSGVILEPHGLVLGEPGELTVTFAKPLRGSRRSRIFWLYADDAALAIADQKKSKTRLKGEIRHFSTYGGRKVESASELLREIDEKRWSEHVKEDFSKVDGRTRSGKIFNNTLDHTFTLLEASKIAESIPDLVLADLLLSDAREVLESGAKRFLDAKQPGKRRLCTDYRSAVVKFVDLLPQFSSAVRKQFSDLLIDLDEGKCLADLSGVWDIKPESGSQTCTPTKGEPWTEDTGSPDSYLFELRQEGFELSGSFPELPKAEAIQGTLEATGVPEFPYSFHFFQKSSNRTPACTVFYDTKAKETVFGHEICPEGLRCVPKFCDEFEETDGRVGFRRLTCGRNVPCIAKIQASWSIVLRYIEIDDEAKTRQTVSLTCKGRLEEVGTPHLPPLEPIPAGGR